jgi:hypothetical protein
MDMKKDVSVSVAMAYLFINICNGKEIPYNLVIRELKSMFDRGETSLSDIDYFIPEIAKNLYEAKESFLAEKWVVITTSLVKELYSMTSYLRRTMDKSLSYKQRSEKKRDKIYKQITIEVLFKYLVEDVNLKNEFATFKEDYQKYFDLTIGVIDNLLENDADNEIINEAIEQRKIQAEKLSNLYPMFELQESELRSVYEDEKIFNWDRDNIEIQVSNL